MLAVQWGWGQGWPFPTRKNKIFLSHLHFGVWCCIPNLPQTPTGFQHPRNVELGTGWQAADFVCRILLWIVVGNITFHGFWSIRSSYFMAVISLLCDLPYLATGYIYSVVWLLIWSPDSSSQAVWVMLNSKPSGQLLTLCSFWLIATSTCVLINLEVLTQRTVSFILHTAKVLRPTGVLPQKTTLVKERNIVHEFYIFN